VRNLFNAIKGLPHAEERPFATPPAVAPQDKLARPEAPTTAVQPLPSQALWLIALRSAARQFPDWRQRRAGFEQCLENVGLGASGLVLRPRPSARYRFSQEKFVGTHGSRRDAPIAVLGVVAVGRTASPLSGPFQTGTIAPIGVGRSHPLGLNFGCRTGDSRCAPALGREVRSAGVG